MEEADRLRRCAVAEKDLIGVVDAMTWLKDRLVMLTTREHELDGEQWAREMTAFASGFATLSQDYSDILLALDRVAKGKRGYRIDKHAAGIAAAFRLTVTNLEGKLIVPIADAPPSGHDKIRPSDSVRPLGS